jgi:hypothetical protein
MARSWLWYVPKVITWIAESDERRKIYSEQASGIASCTHRVAPIYIWWVPVKIQYLIEYLIFIFFDTHYCLGGGGLWYLHPCCNESLGFPWRRLKSSTSEENEMGSRYRMLQHPNALFSQVSQLRDHNSFGSRPLLSVGLWKIARMDIGHVFLLQMPMAIIVVDL